MRMSNAERFLLDLEQQANNINKANQSAVVLKQQTLGETCCVNIL